MADALRKAWAAFRKAQLCGWPLDHLVMPHEQRPVPVSRPLALQWRSRESLRLARNFSL